MIDVFAISVVWSALALVGLGVGLLSVGEAVADRAALKASGKNGVRLVVAHGALVSEGIRMGVQTLLLLIGIGSMASPFLSEGRAPLVYMLTLVVGLLAFNSYYNLTVRRVVIKSASSLLVLSLIHI